MSSPSEHALVLRRPALQRVEKENPVHFSLTVGVFREAQQRLSQRSGEIEKSRALKKLHDELFEALRKIMHDEKQGPMERIAKRFFEQWRKMKQALQECYSVDRREAIEGAQLAEKINDKIQPAQYTSHHDREWSSAYVEFQKDWNRLFHIRASVVSLFNSKVDCTDPAAIQKFLAECGVALLQFSQNVPSEDEILVMSEIMENEIVDGQLGIRIQLPEEQTLLRDSAFEKIPLVRTALEVFMKRLATRQEVDCELEGFIFGAGKSQVSSFAHEYHGIPKWQVRKRKKQRDALEERARKFNAEQYIAALYNALRYCLAIFKAGKVLRDAGATQEQKQQGMLMIEMIKIICERLAEFAVLVECKLQAKDVDISGLFDLLGELDTLSHNLKRPQEFMQDFEREERIAAELRVLETSAR